MKTLKRYVIKTKSGKILRLKDKFNSIDKPFLEITNEELTKEHYKIIQIEVSKVI